MQSNEPYESTVEREDYNKESLICENFVKKVDRDLILNSFGARTLDWMFVPAFVRSDISEVLDRPQQSQSIWNSLNLCFPDVSPEKRGGNVIVITLTASAQKLTVRARFALLDKPNPVRHGIRSRP